MLLALTIVLGTLSLSHSNSTDSKLIKIAELHQSLLGERDLRIDENERKMTELRNLLDAVMKNNTILQKAVAEKISDLEEEVRSLQRNLTHTQTTLQITDKEVDKLRSENSGLKRNVTSLNREFTTTKEELTEIRTELESLKSEVESCAKLTSEGRISQSILPGSYAEYSLEDIQWQSLHMAAAAACRGSTPSKGRHSNRAIPGRDGVTCTQVCSETFFSNCEGAVALMGLQKQTLTNTTPVGLFYDYGCEWNQRSGLSELTYANKKILYATYYINYCCCRY